MKKDNKGYESDLEDVLIEIHIDLEAKVLFKSKNLSEYWCIINTTTKYLKRIAAAGPLLLALHTLYMVEAGISHENANLTKQRSKLNHPNRGDLRLKLANFQPNMNNIAVTHQAHLYISVNYFTTKVCL